MESYKIKLPQFEGPFDLLLFFIERDEIDIQDIPIAKITQDFLNYIQKLRELNIKVASEFILVASKLMHIKARMLLPRKEYDEEGQEVDPRQELVERLVEYKVYKQVAQDMRELEQDRNVRVKRGNVDEEIKDISEQIAVEAEMESVTVYKLMKAYKKALNQHTEDTSDHVVYHYPYSVKKQKEQLLKIVKDKGKATFEHIFSQCQDRLQGIFAFLALLELIQQQMLHIHIGNGYNNFFVKMNKE